MPPKTQYDLIVVGSGPSGQKAAICACKMGKRVALIERSPKRIGGVCLHTGTIPSKTIREAILFLTGYQQKGVFTENYSRRRQITMEDLRAKLDAVVQRERHIIFDQLRRNLVDCYHGTAEFKDRNTISVRNESDETEDITGQYILLATGSRPSRPNNIPFDGERIFDSDEILTIKKVPDSMIVIGGGVIGLEYGIMFAALGVKVSIVDNRADLLNFCDREIVDYLTFSARAMGVKFLLGEEVSKTEKTDDKVIVTLGSQKTLVADTAFFSVGRIGDTESLKTQRIGLETDSRLRIKCDEKFRTNVDNVFAVGDVIGFPSLASTSMEQGRQAVQSMFHSTCEAITEIPYGLFTIPEIAMIGPTEQQLTDSNVPFEVGISNFEELPKSAISASVHGMLKLLFHRETKQLLAAHCIGLNATEIIHIGQMAMHFGATVDDIAHTVYCHPTISESYKVAALNALGQWSQSKFQSIPNHPSLPTVEVPVTA